MIKSKCSKQNAKGEDMGKEFFKALDMLNGEDYQDTGEVYPDEQARLDNQQQAMTYVLEGRI